MDKVKIEINSIVEDLDDAGLVENSEKTQGTAIGNISYRDNAAYLSYSETNEKVTTKLDIIIKDIERKQSQSAKENLLTT